MIPARPFDEFKWRWLSTMPTEGLLVPSVFLGVLRACADNDGCATGDARLLGALGKVQAETGTSVDLVRDSERNLIRNSGQYWKGTGLIKDDPGRVNLSPLGWDIATSELSQDDFAALVIQQTVLPNESTFDDDLYQQWVDAGIRFKPFVMILSLMVMMGQEYGHDEAYLTESELTKVVVPLSGTKVAMRDYLQCIRDFRDGKLDLSGWPDCTPDSNDKRMAREFLYFLRNFGVCAEHDMKGSGNNRFALMGMSQIDDLVELDVASESLDLKADEQARSALEQAMQSSLPGIIERQRTLASVLLRPEQAQFRKRVLQEFRETCLITGDTVPKVLEAAHIMPASSGGSDNTDNGLCLRTDIHRLYDSQLLRISPDGSVNVSGKVRGSPGYANLPKTVGIPAHVSKGNMEWRNRYC